MSHTQRKDPLVYLRLSSFALPSFPLWYPTYHHPRTTLPRLIPPHPTGTEKELSTHPKSAQLLERLSLLTRFGLGHKRTLDQLIEFTGLDLRTGKALGDRCKELHWVPFTPDRDAETEDGDVWGFAPEGRPAGGADIPLRSGEVVIAVPGTRTPTSGRGSGSADNASGGSASGSGSGSGSRRVDSATADPPSAHSASLLRNDKLARIEAKIERDVERVVEKVDGELWWVFQHVDTAVEGSIDYIDGLMGEGKGHGHRVMKVVLLGAPVFVGVVLGAVYVLTGGSLAALGGDEYKGDTKRI